MCARRVAVPLLCLLLAAATAEPARAQGTRPFFMGASAVQAFPAAEPLYRNGEAANSMANAAADSDYLTVFPEYLGIPFDDFAASATLPAAHPWAVAMRSLASRMRAAMRPVVVQLVLSRDRMAAKAVNQGGKLAINRTWAPGCFDFAAPANAAIGTAYANYAAWMAGVFAPAHLVLMVEANLYYVHCGGNTASWTRFVNIEREAYRRAKLAAPQAAVYPSFKLEDVYGQSLNGFDAAQWNAMALLQRDRIGVATYPFSLRRADGSFLSPYELPSDYLSRIRDRYPSEPKIVVTETGWNTASLTLGDAGVCYHDFPYSNESFAYAYLNQLLSAAYSKGFDGVLWWSDRDLIQASAMGTCYPLTGPPSFPLCNGELWCTSVNQMKAEGNGWTPLFAEMVFKIFGTMGLRTYDGTPRSQLAGLWKTHQAVRRIVP